MSGASVALTVNGDEVRLPGPVTVEALVAHLAIGRRGVAVAVNAEVVPRSTWATTTLAAGDAVEVLRAAQGG